MLHFFLNCLALQCKVIRTMLVSAVLLTLRYKTTSAIVVMYLRVWVCLLQILIVVCLADGRLYFS